MEPEYSPKNRSLPNIIEDNLIKIIGFIAIAGIVIMTIRSLVAEPHKVYRNSMEPNFHDGDYLITSKISLRFSEPERGDVVILQNPRYPDRVLIKRIIGLPGERIKIQDGQVYIDNQALSEQYLPGQTLTLGGTFLPADEEMAIPENQYFVMGDNRAESSDSREWGFLKKDLIIGKAFLKFWPLAN